MKNTILLIIAFVLVFLAGFQVGRLTVKPEEETRTVAVEQAQSVDEEDPGEYDDYEAYMSNKYEGMRLEGGATAKDYKGRDIRLDTIGGNKTLFARYSSSGCRPCIDGLIEPLKKYGAEHPDWRIVVLIKGIALRDVYVQNKEMRDNFLLLSTDRLPMDFNEADTPYAFQIVDGKIKNHFLCRYGEPERTEDYVKKMFNVK